MKHRSHGKKKAPDKIHAPYNFVPGSAFVYQPPWGASVSRDLPYADGLNGNLTIRIEAHTPLLVGGEQVKSDGKQPGKVFPAVGFDGRAEIPGSGLKGMIRNLLSIASFGKMDKVDDQWLSIRDLTSAAETLYRNYMTNRDTSPRVKAGFLQPAKNQNGFAWYLTRCQFKFVEHECLDKLGAKLGVDPKFKFHDRQSSMEKYRAWGMPRLATTFNIRKPSSDNQNRITPQHEKACDLGKGAISGRLVFTGQPSHGTGKDKKYQEYVFYDHEDTVALSESVVRKFMHVHRDSDEWRFWEKRLHCDDGVPVFYLEKEGEPSEIGLARMFRLAYHHSVGSLLDRLHFHHRDPEVLDLAAVLFGHISDLDRGLAGRVSFSNARLVGEIPKVKPVEVVLNSPKPSYYPAYIEQDHLEDGKLRTQPHQTMMDDDAELRGWKRYPVRPNCGGYDVNREKGKKVSVKVRNHLYPLPTGSVFTGTVRVHNLRPLELGALLWCLTWGEQPHLRHALGMGKPFGMGQVSVQVTDLSLIRNDGGTVPDVTACISQFINEMERAYRAAVVNRDVVHHGWAGSEQITQLMAMADPSAAPGLPRNLYYMERDAFQASKGRTENDPRLALLPYAHYDGPRDRDLFQRWTREDWDEHRRAELAAAEAAAEAEARAAALAAMTPEQRALAELEQQLAADLASPQAEAKATFWYKALPEYAAAPLQADLIARALRDYYQSKGKWSAKKLTDKQKKKVAEIKRYLLDEGAADVPQ